MTKGLKGIARLYTEAMFAASEHLDKASVADEDYESWKDECLLVLIDRADGLFIDLQREFDREFLKDDCTITWRQVEDLLTEYEKELRGDVK